MGACVNVMRLVEVHALPILSRFLLLGVVCLCAVVIVEMKWCLVMEGLRQLKLRCRQGGEGGELVSSRMHRSAPMTFSLCREIHLAVD